MNWVPQYSAWYCTRCNRYIRPYVQATPRCPLCGQQSLFYSRYYRRWYCTSCKKYPEYETQKKVQEEAASKAAQKKPAAASGGETLIEDLFLLYNDGRLIKHYTRRIKPTIDTDVLSGMLSAIQDFVRDSIKSEEASNLEEIRLGKMRIFLQKGTYVSIAVMVEGEDKEGIESQVKRAIADVETKFQGILSEWDGTMNTMKPLSEYMDKLLAGDYK